MDIYSAVKQNTDPQTTFNMVCESIPKSREDSDISTKENPFDCDMMKKLAENLNQKDCSRDYVYFYVGYLHGIISTMKLETVKNKSP